MSDKASDACLQNCLQKLAVKGLCEDFPASAPKTFLFVVFRQQGHATSEQEGDCPPGEIVCP